MKTVLVALNPRAGASAAGDRIRELEELLRQSGLKVEVEPDLDRMSGRAAQLQAAEVLDCVVSAGGDGTVAAVINPPELRTFPWRFFRWEPKTYSDAGWGNRPRRRVFATPFVRIAYSGSTRPRPMVACSC